MTLVSTGSRSAAAVNAGRLGYRHGGEIVHEDAAGLVVEASAARLDLPPTVAVRAYRGHRSRRVGGRGRTPIAVSSGCRRAPSAAREALARGLRPAGDRRRRNRGGDRGARGREGLAVALVDGGMIGAAVAAHAARAGLAVALVDAGDFGSGTSSASSKLIHGGLRYLRLGDVRLVREAHHERRTLAGRRAAPRAPPPVPAPALPRGPVPARVRAERHPAVLDARAVAAQLARRAGPRARARPAAPRRRAFARARSTPTPGRTTRGCASRTSSPRRTRARRCSTAPRSSRSGSSRGACGGARCASTASRRRRARASSSTRPGRGSTPSVGSRIRAPARRCGSARACTSSSRAGDDWTAALTIPQDDVRVTFAVPWYGMLLLGTTDSDYEGDPGAVAVERRRTSRRSSTRRRWRCRRRCSSPSAVRASFAGLRVLPVGRRRDGERAARDGLLDRSAAGC